MFFVMFVFVEHSFHGDQTSLSLQVASFRGLNRDPSALGVGWGGWTSLLEQTFPLPDPLHDKLFSKSPPPQPSSSSSSSTKTKSYLPQELDKEWILTDVLRVLRDREISPSQEVASKHSVCRQCGVDSQLDFAVRFIRDMIRSGDRQTGGAMLVTMQKMASSDFNSPTHAVNANASVLSRDLVVELRCALISLMVQKVFADKSTLNGRQEEALQSESLSSADQAQGIASTVSSESNSVRELCKAVVEESEAAAQRQLGVMDLRVWNAFVGAEIELGAHADADKVHIYCT